MQENVSSSSWGNDNVEVKGIDENIILSDQRTSSWHKAKKCCKIYCIASTISLMVGVVSFLIAMGVAVSNLSEGKYEFGYETYILFKDNMGQFFQLIACNLSFRSDRF